MTPGPPPSLADHIPDRELRACVIRLLHAHARAYSDEFTAAMFLTYPAPPRLAVVVPMSGDLDCRTLNGAPLPAILEMLASAMSSPAGQVLCRAMLPVGFNGLVVIGHAYRTPSHAHSLIKKRDTLMGFNVHADGRSYVGVHDLSSGAVEDMDPVREPTLQLILDGVWGCFDVINNMTQVELPGNAAELTREIVHMHPHITLASGHVVHEGLRRGFRGNKGSPDQLLRQVTGAAPQADEDRKLAVQIVEAIRHPDRPRERGR